jgi:hypothetical protein
VEFDAKLLEIEELAQLLVILYELPLPNVVPSGEEFKA